MIKAIIFDLDGTLLNRDASVKDFIGEQYERFGGWVKHIPKEKFIRRFIELDARGYVWKDKVYKQLIEEFDITNLTWENLFQDYIDAFKYSCVPFPNLFIMLETLKQKSFLIGMITNGKNHFQMDNIVSLGIEKYFDTILISESEGIKKPDPEIFNKAMKLLNVSPKESIYVGDHPLNDVQAARNVGMKGIWKKDSHWSNVEADFIIDDLIEIPLLVKKLDKVAY